MSKIVSSCAVILCLFLAACSAKTYQITMKSGEVYTAEGDPQYDVQAETYKFQNEDGAEVVLNRKDIALINERK